MREAEDVPLFAASAARETLQHRRFEQIGWRSSTGSLVPLGELGSWEKSVRDRSIYHKNLMPVVYVTADVAGREESPVYPILNMDEKIARR